MNYDNYVIDPPWPQRKGGFTKLKPTHKSRELDYRTMSLDEINGFLSSFLNGIEHSHNVFLWGIDKFLVPGEAMMEGLGYKRHARIIWDKVNGMCPAFTVRYCHEYLSWFYKPSLLKVAKEQQGKLRTVITEGSRQHSRKPDAAYSYIKTLYPDSRCLDVFSRESRHGWDAWGNETGLFDEP